MRTVKNRVTDFNGTILLIKIIADALIQRKKAADKRQSLYTIITVYEPVLNRAGLKIRWETLALNTCNVYYLIDQMKMNGC